MTGEYVIYYDDLKKDFGVPLCPFCDNDQFYVDIMGMEPKEKIVSRTCTSCYSTFPLMKTIPVTNNEE